MHSMVFMLHWCHVPSPERASSSPEEKGDTDADCYTQTREWFHKKGIMWNDRFVFFGMKRNLTLELPVVRRAFIPLS